MPISWTGSLFSRKLRLVQLCEGHCILHATRLLVGNSLHRDTSKAVHNIVQSPIVEKSVVEGPVLLVLSGGLLMITFRPKSQKLATGLLATEYQTLTPDQPKSLIASP